MSFPPPPASHVAASQLEAAVGSALDGLRTFRVRYWAPVLMGVIMLFDSWDSVAIAYVMPSMAAEWRISPGLLGLIISSGYGGQFVGAITLSALAERYGRMPLFIVSVALMAMLAVACALAPNYEIMMALRFAQGIMIGGAMPISITYINELAPTATRGRYFLLFQTLAISGYAAASVASTFIIPVLGWRWLLGLGAIPLLLLPLVALTLPESPRWLARAGRPAEASRALEKLGGAPLMPPPSLPTAPPARASAAGVGKPLNVVTLFDAKFRRLTVVVTLLWFLTHFVNFGITTWIPSIYVTVYHMPVVQALRYSAAVNVIFFLIASPAVGLLIDPVGRRPFAIGSTLTSGAALLSLAVFRPSVEVIVALLASAGQLAIGVGGLILWTYTAESYPTKVRALALGYGCSIARGASMLTPLFVGAVLGAGASIAIVFAVFGTCALAALAIWVTQTHETARTPLDAT